MKTNELKLGNYVLYKKRVYVVKSISINTLSIETFNGYIRHNINISHIKRIRINEDWLSRFGFDKVVTEDFDYYLKCIYFIDDVELIAEQGDTYLFVKYGNDYISSVHELQNIRTGFVYSDHSSIRLSIDNINY